MAPSAIVVYVAVDEYVSVAERIDSREGATSPTEWSVVTFVLLGHAAGTTVLSGTV